MSTLGVGSFLQGVLSGYKTSAEMAMQQEKLDLEEAKLEVEKTKKDKEIKLKQQELDIKIQEKQNKVLKDATDKLEENVIKDTNYAVGYYNKTMEENELPNRKALIIGQDGKEYVTDFDKDTINGHPKIQASLNNKDGMYIVKDGYIHSRNPDGGYTRTNMFGESVDNLKEAFEIKKVGTGTVVLEDGTIVPAYKGIGKKAQNRTPQTKVEINMKNEETVYNRLNEFTNQIIDYKDPKQMQQAQIISNQLLDKQDTKTKDKVAELKSTINSLPELERLAERTDALNRELLKTDKSAAVATGVTKLSQFFGSQNAIASLAKMKEEDIAKMTGLSVAGAKIVADYAKEMSGLSMPQSQFETYKDIIIGGDWTHPETRAVKIKEFIGGQKRKVEDNMYSYGNYMLPEKYKFEQTYSKQNTPAKEEPIKQQTMPEIKPVTKDEVIKQGVAYEPDKYEYAIIDGKLKKRLKGN